MSAVTVGNSLPLPRIPRPAADGSTARRVSTVVTAHRRLEGAGFGVRRPFPGRMSMRDADPFLFMDHLGPRFYGPGAATGAPWYPHRGFETVAYRHGR